MSQISDRILSMAESATLAMTQKSRELQAQGLDIINLSIGEPDFNTPEHIKAAAIKAILDNQTHYPPVPGYPELRKAVVARMKSWLGLEYDPAQVIVSAGGKHSLVNIILAVINKDDEVILPAPYWVTYTEQVKLAEGKSVIVPTGIEQDFKMKPEQLEAAITPRTRLLILCSPSNPTGSMYTKEELEGLAAVLRKHPDVLVMSDEIYDMISYGQKHYSMAQMEGMQDRVIIANGMSKGYAMTGWRMGYVCAPLDVAKAVNKLQGQMTSGICTITQAASIAALTESDEPSRKMTAEFKHRRDIVFDLLSEIKGIKVNMPAGAFYFFPNIEAFLGKKTQDGKVIENSSDLAMYLLTVGHVATVAGSAFGAEGYIRLSYATSQEKLRTAIKRIADALKMLQ
ncbi:MAG: pyridoxal phosphate-dependent aminotransferase [Marinilabiliaceae bacterium]